MITLTAAENDILYLQGEGSPNTLRLAGFAEAVALHQQLGDWIAEQRGDGYISTADARAIAQAGGYDLPFPTINSACTRGNIPGGRKRRGRWLIPKAAFEEWFQQWKAGQERRANAPQ